MCTPQKKIEVFRASYKKGKTVKVLRAPEKRDKTIKFDMHIYTDTI